MASSTPSLPPSFSLFLLLLSCLYSRALSAATVTPLPGFNGPLPFHLEIGYVMVDEVNDVQLFYYFIESEGNPKEDPIPLWLTGGSLVFEIGPLKFRSVKYNGSLPTLIYNPCSWTKVSSIIFLDSPVGTGFSFSRCYEGYEVGDITSSKQVHKFLLKWLIDRPHFLANHLYIAGDSYAGKVVLVVAQEIAEGTETGHQQLLNLKGYLIGNPATGDKVDKNAVISYLHGVGIISDELYESIKQNCEGEDYGSSSKPQCVISFDVVDQFLSEIEDNHILEPKCAEALARPKEIIRFGRFLNDNTELQAPPPIPAIWCRSYGYFLSYYWANNNVTREALHIEKGTVREWQRCNYDLPYTGDIPSSIKFHVSLSSRGYRSLVYSGDHDAVVPFLGTQAWIRSLNFSIVDDWRSWHVVAGYTRTYANNMTFATVKGAGHTAPEYRPKECLAMLRRWLSHKPL